MLVGGECEKRLGEGNMASENFKRMEPRCTTWRAEVKRKAQMAFAGFHTRAPRAEQREGRSVRYHGWRQSLALFDGDAGTSSVPASNSCSCISRKKIKIHRTESVSRRYLFGHLALVHACPLRRATIITNLGSYLLAYHALP